MDSFKPPFAGRMWINVRKIIEATIPFNKPKIPPKIRFISVNGGNFLRMYFTTIAAI
jgi:hypothetical protein